jgi:hypothetical protein
MSAETISQAAESRPGAPRQAQRAMRPVVGVLADGTPFYAPIGEVVADDSRIACHLCGRWLRSVTAHLKAHGWSKDAYCEAFGLERGQPLEGAETRKLRAAALSARLVFEPAIRDGSAAGRQRARSGQLTRDAAAAARGRRIPEQRRRKAVRALASIPAAVTARANRERADRSLARLAAVAARQLGYPDIGALVQARMADGASLAEISREAGLHKDWLSRHLARVDPAAAAAASLAFASIADYVSQRRAAGWTWQAMAAESGHPQSWLRRAAGDQPAGDQPAGGRYGSGGHGSALRPSAAGSRPSR